MPLEGTSCFKQVIFLCLRITHITSAISNTRPTMTPMTIPIIAPSDTEHNK